MRNVLITKQNCLDSLLAVNWANKQPQAIEIVAYEEIPDIAEIYGVGRFPTLLSIGEHGVVTKREGYNALNYEEVIGYGK